MTAPEPQSAPLLEPPPPPVLAPPTTATPPPPGFPPGQRPLPPIGDLMVMLGGLLILGFSFAPFVSYKAIVPDFRLGTFEVNASAWEWTAYLAPLTWFVVLGGLFLLALGLTHMLSGERRLFTFQVSQLQLLVALYALSVLVGYALTSKSMSTVNVLGVQTGGEFAWGGVLMLVGALIAAVGAVFNFLRQPAFGYFGHTGSGQAHLQP